MVVSEKIYVGHFPVDLGMPVIFTDFQYCTWLKPTSNGKILKNKFS